MFPTVTDIPSLSTDQMIEVDRVMVEELGIDLRRMMENAGRSLATLALALFRPVRVTVLAGSGGNGGGAMVAARHLANRGVDLSVTTSRVGSDLSAASAEQFHILKQMGVPTDREPPDADLVIDGLIGYSLHGPPSGRSRELIAWTAGRTVLSLDVPSGVDAATGSTPGSSVMAQATLTLALPKSGIVDHPNTGRLFLADISVPPAVYKPFGIDIRSPFAAGPIVEVLR